MTQEPSLFDRDDDPLPRRIAVGLHRLGMALRSQTWQEAAGRGLTPTQGQILALLRGRDGVRLGDVAQSLGASAASVSESVRVLVGKGLVHKARDEDDGRAVVLRLSAAGTREATRAAHWPDFLVGAVEALGPEEQRTLLMALVKMIRTLQERGEIPIARMCVSCRFFQPDVHADPESPHHCAYVDAPFGPRHLRLDCDDHEPADAVARQALWDRFSGSPR
jgi:DNA-binding MarR family transcriptional regulator